MQNKIKPMASSPLTYIKTNVTFKYNWYTWRLVGTHPPKHFKWLYYLYSIVFNVLFTALYPVTLVVQVYLTDNFKQLLESLTLTTTNVINTIKQLNSFLYRNDLLAINCILDKLDARVGDAAQQNILRKLAQHSHRIIFVYYCIYLSTVLSGEIATIFASPRRLMYRAWFPFDWQATELNFAVVHIYQFIGITFGTLQEGTNDTYPGLYMAALTAHLRALIARIRVIGTNSIKSQDENYSHLIECIQDYQLLNEFYRVLQTVISKALFMQFFATGIVAGITAVYVFFADTTIFDMFYLGLYFLCVLMEILLSCYYGNELIYESYYVTEAIYGCNWIEQSRKFKCTVLMFMQSAQKNMEVKAGGIVIVNLPSFLTVVKTSYSFFAVLLKVT